ARVPLRDSPPRRSPSRTDSLPGGVSNTSSHRAGTASGVGRRGRCWVGRMAYSRRVGGKGMAASYVLVVDDDPAIRGLVGDALRSEGYTVDLAAHGREALDAMRARRPSTVVLDLMMPV